MIAYKFLRADGAALFSGYTWVRPAGGAPGDWIEAAGGPLVACRNGVHAAALDDLAYWIGDELWQVELDGETLQGPQCLVARRGRLLRRVDTWDPDGALEFGRRCEARVTAHLAQTRKPVSARAHAYARECSAFVAAGDGAVAAYAAALARAALAGEPDAESAYCEERREQSRLLAALLGLT